MHRGYMTVAVVLLLLSVGGIGAATLRVAGGQTDMWALTTCIAIAFHAVTGTLSACAFAAAYRGKQDPGEEESS